jgi:hypothetical protein
MQSGTYRYTPTFLECRHCAALTGWPRWARIEHLHYAPFCWLCFDALDQDFTIAAAIHQASAIVRGSAVAR